MKDHLEIRTTAGSGSRSTQGIGHWKDRKDRSSDSPRLVAVTAGDPFDPLARSGSNLHLFTALARSGALAGAVNGRPAFLDFLERLGAFARDRETRGQRRDSSTGHLSSLTRRLASLVGWRRARRIDSRPDALLQVGAWYDFARLPGLEPTLRCSYHDGNLAVFLARPDIVLDSDSPLVRRALAYERRVYGGLDLILPRSEWLRRSFVEDFGVDPDKVVAVGAGLNLHSIPEVPERDFSAPRLLFVGKDFRRKGGEQLLAAFARLRDRRPDAELRIVGPPDPPPGMPGVRFVGQIRRDTPAGEAELLRLYRQATVFVMPSVFEPWGSVFLEAMAFALPCIGSDCCAMPELVLQGATGYLAAPGSVDSLHAVCEAVIKDPVRARAMGEAGRRRVLDHFSWDHVAGRIVEAVSARLAERAVAEHTHPGTEVEELGVESFG